MPPRHWISVVHQAQVEAAREGGFVAFSHGSRSAVEKVGIGDGVIYYSPKTDLGGRPVQAFTALAEVAGMPEEREIPAYEVALWVRPAVFEDVGAVPIRPFLPRLELTRDRKSWGMAFRRSQVAISAADFTLIAGAMRDAQR